MKKKLRGFKRKWNKMIFELNEQGIDNRHNMDEIFIEESFEQYERRISNSYKNELITTMTTILNQKQKQKDNKYYLLWCPPKEIFESVILIFNSLDQVKIFFEGKKSNAVKDSFLLRLSKKRNFDQFIFMKDIFNKNDFIVFSGGFDGKYDTPIIIVSDHEILKIAKNVFVNTN